MISDPDTPKKLSANEGIKERSNFLRGTIMESLMDESTGAITAEDAQLTKFHGTYMQDDRDKRASLLKEKKEKAYSFMIRVRVPGGVCTPAQWLGIDALADKFGESTLKLTTRQAFQLYGVLKKNLRQTMKEINDTLLDTLAACGIANRMLCPLQIHLNPSCTNRPWMWPRRFMITLLLEPPLMPKYG